MVMKSEGKRIYMDLHDFGIMQVFTVKNLQDFESGDMFIMEIRKSKNDNDPILTKTFDLLQKNDDNSYSFTLEFTQGESEQLAAGDYVYTLKHYREGQLRNTLVNNELFRVRSGV